VRAAPGPAAESQLSPQPRQRPRCADEAGTGLIGSLAGFVVFVVLLLVAVQVLFDLYARSAVTAAAFDAARRVAGYDLVTLPADQLAQAEAGAEAQARQTLGRYGSDVIFTWTLTANEVELRVQTVNERLLPETMARSIGIDRIDRTVRVRAERLVCAPTASCPSPAPTITP
jgi:hypothetical protein